MKKILITFLLLIPFWGSQAQGFQLFQPGSQWILETSKIEKKKLVFVEYKPEKVDMNTMIWTFSPGGMIEYDYQSSADIYACAGVDFLDMDLSECRWDYDAPSQTVTLLIKGGYASIDDFVFKKKYKIEIKDDDEDNYGYILKEELAYFYNNLNNR